MPDYKETKKLTKSVLVDGKPMIQTCYQFSVSSENDTRVLEALDDGCRLIVTYEVGGHQVFIFERLEPQKIQTSDKPGPPYNPRK